MAITKKLKITNTGNTVVTCKKHEKNNLHILFTKKCVCF